MPRNTRRFLTPTTTFLIIGLVAIALLATLLLVYGTRSAQAQSLAAVPGQDSALQSLCGNGVCDTSIEDCSSCPTDCGKCPDDDDDGGDQGGFCGDGIAQSNEQCGEPGLGGCANHVGFEPGTATCVNCRCQVVGVCGDQNADPGETCGEPGLSCAAGEICSNCRCAPQPTCGNQIAEAGEACGEPGLACADGEVCARCQCFPPQQSFCGDQNADPGEECGEPGLACQPGSVCNYDTCGCETEEICEEPENGEMPPAGTPLTHVPQNVEGVNPKQGSSSRICDEEDNCVTVSADEMNHNNWHLEGVGLECCVLGECSIMGQVDWYVSNNGYSVICSTDLSGECKPWVPPGNCQPVTTDEIPGGDLVLMHVRESSPPSARTPTGGQLASMLPPAQEAITNLYGYVCDEPGELCIDLDDAAAFEVSNEMGDHDGLVLWDCALPDDSITTVNIANNAFPDIITVPVFTTVNWTNDDQQPHTVTADDDSYGSGPLQQGQTFGHTYNLYGDFPYHSEGEDMTGIVRVVPLCEQKPLTVVDGSRACAQCEGDWCGFAPGKPNCVLVPYDDMPELWQARYDIVEGEAPAGVEDVTDGVWALVCAAPPQGRTCIPIDAAMQSLYDDPDAPLGLTDCFSGEQSDPTQCPVLGPDMTLETDADGQSVLCFEAGEAAGFEPSCGPHPNETVNGCAFSVQTTGFFPDTVADEAAPVAQEDTAGGFPVWLLLLIAGLLLLLLIVLLTLRRRGDESDETMVH